MNSLVAKIMSKEDLPDSDARKTYSLYPIPPHCLISFRRGEQAPELLLESKEGNLPSTIIPLTDCGNVYILGDGKTISTFCPDPYPVVPRSVTGVTVETRGGDLAIKAGNDSAGLQIRGSGEIHLSSPKLSVASSQPINVPHPNVYNDVLELLNLMALPSTYPMAGVWNAEIAKGFAERYDPVGNDGITLHITLSDITPPESATTIANYRNRVNDALLNYKQPYRATLIDQDAKGYFVTLVPATLPRDVAGVTQTDKTALDDRGLTGLINNQMLRAFKLIALGARTMVLSPRMIIGTEEGAAVKEVFKQRNKLAVTLVQQGQHVLMMKFNNITEA